MTQPPVIPQQEQATARHPMAEAWEMFRRNHAAMVALAVLTLIILIAIFGPSIYPTDPFDMVWAPFSPPGADGFLLGTDYLGRDLLAALIHGSRVSIVIGLAAAFMSVFIGPGRILPGLGRRSSDAGDRILSGPSHVAVLHGDRGALWCIAADDHIRHRYCQLDSGGPHYPV
jgi:hypothetical protein